ncbi:MAG: PEGA domain-containing protein, partial [Candidatus Latescibacterota bacterium]
MGSLVSVLAVLLLAAAGAQAGEHHALLVGVDRVPGIGPEFDLKYAERDVHDLQRLLVDKGYYAPENVHVLTGSGVAPEEAASWSGIRSTLKDVLARSLQPDDVLLVYLALHGTLIREGDQTRRAFLPHDARKGSRSTYIRDEELGSWLADIRARKVLVLDACFAGDKGSRFFRDQADRALILPEFVADDPLVRQAHAVLTASGHDEPAADGALAQVLGQALQTMEQADRDRDGRLSPAEVHAYVVEHLQGQHPELLPGAQDVPLVDATTGYLSVETDPPGAEVWFGTERLGVTPLKRRATPAVTNELVLRRDGYEERRVPALRVLPGYAGNEYIGSKGFQLYQRKGGISGRVVGPRGEPVEGVLVTLLGAADLRTTTGADGAFELRAPYGQYSGLAVQKSGWRAATHPRPMALDAARSSHVLDAAVSLEPAMGRLSISSEPPGARVFLGDEPAGATPLQRPWRTGTFAVRLEADGHRPRFATLTVEDGAEARLSAPLEKLRGTLVVLCEPADAVIFIDDGATAWPADNLRRGRLLRVGPHTVRVARPGFSDHVQQVAIRDGQETRVQAHLVKGGAYVSVRNVPPGARVVIRPAASSPREFLGPLEREAVPAGEVVVVASARGYEPWSARFTLPQDQVKVLVPELRPRSRLKALGRSLAFPAWGSFYNQRLGHGTLFLLGALGAAGGFGYAQSQFMKADDEYAAAQQRYGRAASLRELRPAEAEVLETFDAVDRWGRLRRLGAAALAGVWAGGVLDALVAGPV